MNLKMVEIGPVWANLVEWLVERGVNREGLLEVIDSYAPADGDWDGWLKTWQEYDAGFPEDEFSRVIQYAASEGVSMDDWNTDPGYTDDWDERSLFVFHDPAAVPTRDAFTGEPLDFNALLVELGVE